MVIIWSKRGQRTVDIKASLEQLQQQQCYDIHVNENHPEICQKAWEKLAFPKELTHNIDTYFSLYIS